MTYDVRLRDAADNDLPIFFEQQRDPIACEMAGFPARERGAFEAHWAKLRTDATLFVKTIVADRQVAGNIGCFEQDGRRQVCYWLGREYWGQGIATRALAELLIVVAERPLFAHVVVSNIASRRVLEKCGFVILEEDGEEEWLLWLPENPGTIAGL